MNFFFDQAAFFVFLLNVRLIKCFLSNNVFSVLLSNICLHQMVVWSKSVFLLNVFLDQIVFLINFLSTNLFFGLLIKCFLINKHFLYVWLNVLFIKCFILSHVCLIKNHSFFIKWFLLSIFLIKIRFSFFYYYYMFFDVFFNQTTFLVIKGFFARQCWTVACKKTR